MNVMKYKGPVEIVTLGIQPGEKLLERIREACREQDIRNGVVLSGIGTFKTCQMHYIKDTEFPPTDVFYTLDKPLELAGVSGIIADYEPHLHIVVGCGEQKAWAGHLEPDSEVIYLAEICIMKFNGLEMTRTLDETRGVKLLGPKQAD